MLELKLGLAKLVAAVSLTGLGLGACSTGESAMPPGAANSPTLGGGGSSSTIITTASGGQTGVVIDTSGAGTSGVVAEVVECTEGVDCTCPTLTVAVIGKPGKWGAPAGDSDTAFQEWLNSSSAGTAKADVYATKPTLTSDFLAAYNVIILASLSDDSNIGPFWTFDSAEVSAFQEWVENKGGGVITLTGYSGDGTETRPTNQLLAFSGISYTNNEGTFAPCLDWAVCNCAGSYTLSAWVKTDAVIANLSNSITWVGFQNGRPITAPADAHVAATVQGNNGPANALVGKIAGTGRVLVYGDEWITYTSQWTGAGIDATTCTAGSMPQDKYQTAQFWFNMIKWVQPRATCFKIVDKEQPVTIW